MTVEPRNSAMSLEVFTHRTSISPKNYIEDYLKHYGRHRPIVVSSLLSGWQESNATQKVILGSRVLMEFGASIEELFAFTYAIYKQCNVALDVPPEESEVFFKHLFAYRHRELYEFVQNNNFKNWIEEQFNLPDRREMARRMSYSERYFARSLSEAERCLEWIKEAFFGRDFRNIYNKLKHPFLVMAPCERNDTGEPILPVLIESPKKDMIAMVVPVEIGLTSLETFQSDILTISQTIEFLLKLLLKKP